METVVSTCRNFKCPSNKSGQCCLESVNLEPHGPHLDILRCIEAPRSVEDDVEVDMTTGVARRPDSEDPSSK